MHKHKHKHKHRGDEDEEEDGGGEDQTQASCWLFQDVSQPPGRRLGFFLFLLFLFFCYLIFSGPQGRFVRLGVVAGEGQPGSKETEAARLG